LGLLLTLLVSIFADVFTNFQIWLKLKASSPKTHMVFEDKQIIVVSEFRRNTDQRLVIYRKNIFGLSEGVIFTRPFSTGNTLIERFHTGNPSARLHSKKLNGEIHIYLDHEHFWILP
jgi:hypothetical protein